MTTKMELGSKVWIEYRKTFSALGEVIKMTPTRVRIRYELNGKIREAWRKKDEVSMYKKTVTGMFAHSVTMYLADYRRIAISDDFPIDGKYHLIIIRHDGQVKVWSKEDQKEEFHNGTIIYEDPEIEERYPEIVDKHKEIQKETEPQRLRETVALMKYLGMDNMAVHDSQGKEIARITDGK